MNRSLSYEYGHTDECNIILHIARKTRVVLETAECGYAREDGVGLFQDQLCHRNIVHGNSVPYLSSTVTRKGVVPKTLMGTSQWLLVMVVITMRCNSSYEAQERRSKPHLAKNFI